jgi:hypothetical protein
MFYGSLLVHAPRETRIVAPRQSTCALFTAE